MANPYKLSRWYVILFFIFVILILIISAYNLYENYRIKTQVPSQYQESQDILFVLNIIAIVIALILLIGYYYAGDKSNYQISNQAINLPETNSIQDYNVVPSYNPVQGPPLTPSPFCRTGAININRL